MTNIQEISEVQNEHAKEYGTTRKEKYIYLSNLSKNLKDAIEEDSLTAEFYEDCETTNAILKIYYSNKYRVKQFNTFKCWQEKGFKVKKGAKAFLFWSKPKKKEDKEKQENEESLKKEKTKYYICYLFSNEQVEKIQNSNITSIEKEIKKRTEQGVSRLHAIATMKLGERSKAAFRVIKKRKARKKTAREKK